MSSLRVNRRRALWAVVLVTVGACASKQLAPLFYRESPTDSLVVTIAGLTSQEGQLMISLFNGAEGFPQDPESAVRREVLPIDAVPMVVRFEKLEAGTYAVSVFHDENGNDQMETDFLGRPSEGWGVSRDARGFMGPPSFEKSSFAFEGGVVETTITLDY